MAYLPPPAAQPVQDIAPKGAYVSMGQGWQALDITMLPGSHPAQDESPALEILPSAQSSHPSLPPKLNVPASQFTQELDARSALVPGPQ